MVVGCGEPLYDDEGRVLRLDFDDVSVLNTYMPSGTSGPARQAFKVAWLHWFRAYVAALRQEAAVPPLVIGGDFNCCQTALDLHNPQANQQSPGFTPEERQWFQDLLADGWRDSFRQLHPDAPGHYSWWSYRGRLARPQRGLAPRPPAARPRPATPPARSRPLARCRSLRPLPGVAGYLVISVQ